MNQDHAHVRPLRSHRRRLYAFAIALAALIWGASGAGTALVVQPEIGSPDAIIMLASHEWERLPAAAALARQHPDAVVLLTVPAVVTPYNCHLCGDRVDWFGVEGVPKARITLLHGRATNTYEEAVAARDLAARVPFKRLAVVTSPYHTRRALTTFRTVFRDTDITVVTVAASPANGNPYRWWADPYDRHYVSYEWAAILKYRLEYGVPIFLMMDVSRSF